MQVRVIDSAEGFLEIRSAWDALLEATEAASVFMSWEWNHSWWKHYGRSHGLRIVTVWEHGQLKAVLPLYLQKSKLFRFWELTCVRLIGTGGDTSPDYLGPIQEPASATRTSQVLANHLFDELREWHVLRLSDLDRNSGFYRELERQCEHRSLPHATTVAARIVYVELPATWNDYLAGVHRYRRNTIRRTRRKIEEQFQGRFHVITDEDQLDDVLASLIRLHHRRWQGNANGHAFSTPEYVGFHSDAIRACARRGWVRFYCLEAEGKRIAVFYCYRFRNRIFYFQAGFDPDYERLRPGLVLIGYALEQAIQEGNTVFDFLRGEHAYKTQWGKSLCETHTLVAYRAGLRAAMCRLRDQRLPEAKRRLKRLLPFLGKPAHARGNGSGDRHDA
jgi:CelD/BcsL family acetyltransferase involved in cellulose biosynthesis